MMGKDTGGKEKTPSSKLFEVLDKVKRESGEKRGAAAPAPEKNGGSGQPQSAVQSLLNRRYQKPQKAVEPKDTTERAPDKTKAPPKRLFPSEKQLREALKRRNALEEKILSLIGGKTGMSVIWEEILRCAAAGDDCGFLFYAGSFPQKAALLRETFEELNRLLVEPQYRDASAGRALARRMTQPYQYDARCRALLAHSARLAESGLLEREQIGKDELTAWRSQFPPAPVQPETRSPEEKPHEKGRSDSIEQ